MFTHKCARCPMRLLHQQYALITGSSQGLGRAFAEECARMGANLILAALPGTGLPEVARDLADRYHVQVEFMETDLTAPGSPEALVNWIERAGWPVTWLINNAGLGYNARFEDSTLQENESCILLNNLALVKITHQMLPILKGNPRGFILNVASLAAFFPMPFMPVYAPSKAFIVNFSLALREEMRGAQVNVSVLCPNGIRTNQRSRAQIEAGGLAARLTCMDADQVAAYGLQKMLEGQPVIIPGWINQIIAAAGKYTPRPIIHKVVDAFWGRTARSAQSSPPSTLEPVFQTE